MFESPAAQTSLFLLRVCVCAYRAVQQSSATPQFFIFCRKIGIECKYKCKCSKQGKNKQPGGESVARAASSFSSAWALSCSASLRIFSSPGFLKDTHVVLSHSASVMLRSGSDGVLLCVSILCASLWIIVVLKHEAAKIRCSCMEDQTPPAAETTTESPPDGCRLSVWDLLVHTDHDVDPSLNQTCSSGLQGSAFPPVSLH